MAKHTLAELEAAIIEKGLKIDSVRDDKHGNDGSLQSIKILSIYRDPEGKQKCIKWDIEGECRSFDNVVRYPNLDLYKEA